MPSTFFNVDIYQALCVIINCNWRKMWAIPYVIFLSSCCEKNVNQSQSKNETYFWWNNSDFCKTQQKELNGKVVPLYLDFVTLFKMLKGKKCVLAVAAGCGGRQQNPLSNNGSSSSTPHKTTTKLPSRMSKIWNSDFLAVALVKYIPRTKKTPEDGLTVKY